MDGFDTFPPRGIFGRSFSDYAVTKQQDGKTRPNNLINDREAGRIRCHFSAKAKRNVRNQQAHSVLLLERIPKEGSSLPLAGKSKGGQHLLWPEESKETGGFVAEDPMGTASPWHTTLHEVRQRRTSESDCLQSPSEASERRSRLMAGIAKYSVLYLRPRLTGKRSVLMQERSFCSAGKRAGFCECKRTKT